MVVYWDEEPGITVGHLPREIAKACYFFTTYMARGGTEMWFNKRLQVGKNWKLFAEFGGYIFNFGTGVPKNKRCRNFRSNMVTMYVRLTML